jgi:hypothetical protein
MRVIIYLMTMLFVFSGCYYDDEELLYGVNPPCASTNVTFSGTINPILSNSGCMNCHSGNNPSGNINLQGYDNVKTVAANGSLYGAVNHSPGFSPMPQGGNKLSPCDISKIKAWIDGGAINN